MVLVLDILINIYFSIQSLKENVILWKSHVVSNASLPVRGSLLFFVFVFNRLWRLVKCDCDVFIKWCGIIADFKTHNENRVHLLLTVIRPSVIAQTLAFIWLNYEFISVLWFLKTNLVWMYLLSIHFIQRNTFVTDKFIFRGFFLYFATLFNYILTAIFF